MHASAARACARLTPVARALARRGLDVWATGPLAAYNARVPTPYQLPGAADAAVSIVGNSRALWPALGRWLRVQPRRAAFHPVHTYTMTSVRDAVGAAGLAAAVFDAHARRGPLPAMVHLAEVTGLAARSPAHLAVHPTLGPWLGLRAAIVWSADHVVWRGPAPTPAPRACDGCDAPCMDALEHALAIAPGGPRGPRPGISAHAADHAWRAIRTTCPASASAAYCPSQLAYHQTHRAEHLPGLAGEVRRTRSPT